MWGLGWFSPSLRTSSSVTTLAWILAGMAGRRCSGPRAKTTCRVQAHQHAQVLLMLSRRLQAQQQAQAHMRQQSRAQLRHQGRHDLQGAGSSPSCSRREADVSLCGGAHCPRAALTHLVQA